jgi:hypothetical protein
MRLCSIAFGAVGVLRSALLVVFSLWKERVAVRLVTRPYSLSAAKAAPAIGSGI